MQVHVLGAADPVAAQTPAPRLDQTTASAGSSAATAFCAQPKAPRWTSTWNISCASEEWRRRREEQPSVCVDQPRHQDLLERSPEWPRVAVAEGLTPPVPGQ
eukprot:3838586-Prymnesium_polylepis.1